MQIPFVDLKGQTAELREEIEAAVSGVLERCDFIQGEALETFEESFAAYLGCEFAIGVNSGTDALRCALLAAGIGPGDDVIVPANTFFATAAAVDSIGARPVLVDATKHDANLDAALLDAAVTPETRAVLAVHLYGRICDVEEIQAFCTARNLIFLEDAAQAHGARLAGRSAGTFGLASGFSFYPGKSLGACGDGGVVATDDSSIAEKARQWRNFGQGEKHRHDFCGLNSRLDTMQAAILQVKLRHLDTWIERRRSIASAYAAALAGVEGVHIVTPPAGERYAPHLFVIRVPRRDEILAALQQRGVGAQIHYPIPIHLQPAFEKLGYREGAFPVAEELAKGILSLPVYPEMVEEQVDYVVAALREALASPNR